MRRGITPNFISQRRLRTEGRHEGTEKKTKYKNLFLNFVPLCLCEMIFPVVIIFCVLLIVGCSSAPKPPTEIFTDRNTATNHLNLAYQTANHGRYEDALFILEEARRLALSTDDPALRIKTSLSRGNFVFALGRHSEAFLEWENAEAEADASGERALAALARIYTIRGRVVLLAAETGETGAVVEELKDRLSQEMALVRSDPFSTAVGNITLGLAEKQLGRWAEAESAVRRALAFHEKELVLEDAAYDWFVIGSIRSMAGNYDASLEALRTAISFDRRAENGFGLASSWQAMGDVLQKAGRTEESRAAWRRAADIYRAINLPEQAEELETRLD